MSTASLAPMSEPLAQTRWSLPARHTTYPLNSSPLIEEQAHLESEVRSYPRRIPLALQQAKGAKVIDEQGHVFLDCLAGAGTLSLGHNHSEINSAICSAMDSLLPMQTLDLTSPAKNTFMRAVLNALPENFAANAKLQFCGPSGADAVEAAIKLAKTATGRRSIISFHGGYHGMTHGALALTGNLSAKHKISNLMADVHFMPYPYALRSAFDKGGDISNQHLRFLRAQLSDPEGGIDRPAAIIVEAVQGEGGVIPAPVEWLRGLSALSKEFDIPLILDEIQSGFARTGAMFAFEHAGICPDIVVMSKALGGGLPLAMIAFKEELDVWSPGAHTGTFRGNQLAMVAGAKSLEIMQRDRLWQSSADLGARLLSQLNTLSKRFTAIGEVRGRGLMIGIEFVDGSGLLDKLDNPLANPRFAQCVQQEALRRGLICELGGRHGAVLRLLPPLIINNEQADFIVHTLEDAIAVVNDGACASV